MRSRGSPEGRRGLGRRTSPRIGVVLLGSPSSGGSDYIPSRRKTSTAPKVIGTRLARWSFAPWNRSPTRKPSETFPVTTDPLQLDRRF